MVLSQTDIDHWNRIECLVYGHSLNVPDLIRIESLEINPQTYGQSLTKKVKIYNEKRQCLQQVVLGKLDGHI